nr:hypothetical protein [Tanacetum cinerariifolium]
MVKSSSSLENEPCCSKACNKNTKCLNSKITDLTDKLSDSKNMLFHYKAGLSQVEGRLVEFKNQEVKYCEKIRVLEFKVESIANCIESLTNELELLKKEKEGLESKLTCFQSASKDLDSLLKSQKSNKIKEGLGYSVVPPHPAQVYSPPKKDMSWTGLPEFADDTFTDYTRPSPSVESNPNVLLNSSSSTSGNGESTSSILSKAEIKFVKATGCAEVKTNKVEAARKSSLKYAEMYSNTSKSPNVRERVEVYYECIEHFKPLMCLWVRSKSIAAIWLEKVVTPLIDLAIKGFTAASAVLKPERLKVDKAR